MEQETVISADGRLEKLCYTIPTAAKVLDLHESTVRTLVHVEGFPVFRVGRKILIKRDRLQEWVKNHPEGLGDLYVRKG